ncbi:type II secretion system protein GspM [Psychromonas algicola]|uniref:type II secretion system protein GspM n=1 Tax=Psychromonas algicola TaxID=2555642 RepID=UPI0010689D59|nr:type II secretion system protein GspM [Psychromonas sp. RZ5]TEW51670.1 hypothetical protein E2R67_06760 [Psychromonas sp. RZ5]
MNNLNVKSFASKFNAFSLRERVMVFAAVIVCFAGGLYLWVVEPFVITSMKQHEQLQTIHREQSLVKLQIEQVHSAKLAGVQQKTNAEITRLQQELQSLDNALTEPLTQFVDPKMMPSVLYQVLAQSKQLKVNIEHLKSLPVSPFYTELELQNEQTAAIYKHTLEVKLTGSYDDLYQYLRRLQALEAPLYWHALLYEVSKYPLASVTLQMYTLSNHMDLIRN